MLGNYFPIKPTDHLDSIIETTIVLTATILKCQLIPHCNCRYSLIYSTRIKLQCILKIQFVLICFLIKTFSAWKMSTPNRIGFMKKFLNSLKESSFLFIYIFNVPLVMVWAVRVLAIQYLLTFLFHPLQYKHHKNVIFHFSVYSPVPGIWHVLLKWKLSNEIFLPELLHVAK